MQENRRRGAIFDPDSPLIGASGSHAGEVMSDYAGKRSKTASNEEAVGAAPPALVPGKRTLVEQLVGPEAPVQRAAAGAAPAEDPAAVHASAQRGTATAAGKLPHGDIIQRLFGRHDVSRVQAHTGPDAQASAREMGAQAYATGDHVVLGAGTDLHTVAHEAAHVVQQRGGVQLKGGVGAVGDTYEQHADAVADRVVAGRSAEDLLDAHAGGGSGGVQRSSVVQRFLAPQQVAQNVPAALSYIKTNQQQIFGGLNGLTGPKAKAKDTPVGKQLLEHVDTLKQVNQEAGLPGAVTGTYQAAEIEQIVRLLNTMEQEKLTGAITSASTSDNYANGEEAPQLDIKVGTEFTFCNDDLRGVKVGQDSEKTAYPFMTAWANKVLAGSQPPAHAQAAQSKSKDKSKAITFTYDLGQGKTWNWTLDVDNGCLETQTQPSSGPELRAAQKIIERDIFGAAKAVGCVPDTSTLGGGGHISLDAQTTFGGSAEVMLATLAELQNNYQAWQKMFGDQDALNAPWLDEMKHGKTNALAVFTPQVEALLKGVERGEVDFGTAASQLKQFNQGLKNPQAEELRKSAKNADKAAGNNVASDPNHYQAVNVEHLDNADASARIELRRIPAQTGGDNLFEHIDFIFNLITEVRATVAAKQKERLSPADKK
jgi:hypothetical protein